MKKLIFIGFLILAVSLWTTPEVSAQAPLPLAAKNIPKWVNQLPLLDVAGGTMDTWLAPGVFSPGAPGTPGSVTIRMCEFNAKVLPPGTFAVGVQPTTWVWGYLVDPTGTSTCADLIDLYDDGIDNASAGPLDTSIGPVIVAERSHFPVGGPTVDNSIAITWVNNLGTTATTGLTFWQPATDQTLHWADPQGVGIIPGNMTHYDGPIPAVPHLHGGEVPPDLDGGPDAWFLSQTQNGYTAHGHAYYSKHDRNNAGTDNYAIYDYPNTMEAANIWFHDHVLGITRLNVYAGMGGAYVITDPNLVLPTGLHPVGLRQGTAGAVDYIIPLVLQDRMFNTAGQLVFPNLGINAEHPFWIPEFVGDTMMVNGKVWPTLGTAAAPIAAKRYRFLFLNGSNARTYELKLFNQVTGANGPPMWVIGTDGGYLDAPVKVDPALGQKLLIMPGERYDVIIDFAGFANQTLILRNSGRTPYPKGAPPNGSTVGQIVQFVIGTAPAGGDLSYNPATLMPIRTGTNSPTFDNQKIKRLVNPVTGTPGAGVTINKTRQLTLNEVMGPGGPLEVLLNNTKWDGYSVATDVFAGGEITGFTYSPHFEGYSEIPTEGSTELWEIINMTADAHPIHLHLVQFQLMNRQNFNVNKYNTAYNALFPGSTAIDPMTGAAYLPGVFIGGYGPPQPYFTAKNCTATNTGVIGGNPCVDTYLQQAATPPLPQERGWKDTVVMYPGQVTRIMVRWAPNDLAIGNTTDNYFPFSPDGGHGYVWHCHIIDHEDNEMMRPTRVTDKSGVTRTYTKTGGNY